MSEKQSQDDYLKERDEAAYRAIDESMMRKLGRGFPKGYNELNPERRNMSDSKYNPLKW